MSLQLFSRIIASPGTGHAGGSVLLLQQTLDLNFRIGGPMVSFRFMVDALPSTEDLRSEAAAREYMKVATEAWSKYAMLEVGLPYSLDEMLAKLGRSIVLGRTFRKGAGGAQVPCGLSMFSRVTLSGGGQPMHVNFVETDFVVPEYWHAGIGKAQVKHILEALSHMNGKSGYLWGAALMQNPLMYGALLYHPQIDLVVPDVRNVDSPVPAPYDRVMPELARLVVGGGRPVDVDYDPGSSLVRGNLENRRTRAFRSVADLPVYQHHGNAPDAQVNDFFRNNLFDASGNNLLHDVLVLFRFRTS